MLITGLYAGYKTWLVSGPGGSAPVGYLELRGDHPSEGSMCLRVDTHLVEEIRDALRAVKRLDLITVKAVPIGAVMYCRAIVQ